MSNEFVMVPRELLERYVSSVEGHGYGFDGDAEIREFLDKTAEQHQGEPVAWRYQVRAGGEWYVTTTEPHARMFAGTDDGAHFEPLYTHADPGEVERKLEDQRREFTHVQAVEHRKWAELVDELRAQLAERDALLRDLVELGICDTNWAELDDILSRAQGVLSASAEPSAPTEREAWALQEEKRLGIERLPVEPCAPVDGDERAAFEAAWAERIERLRIRERGNEFYRVQPNDLYRWSNVQDAWELWQARAALERKP